MIKNIIFCDSGSDKSQTIISILEALSGDFSFHFLGNKKSATYNFFSSHGWLRTPAWLGVKKPISSLLLLPLMIVFYFFRLLNLKRKYSIDALICCQLNEKIFLTLPAKILGLKIFWLELPPFHLPMTASLSYKFLLRFVKIIGFTRAVGAELEKNKINKNIALLSPVISIKRDHQENIFNTLAANTGENYRRKLFTIGTMANLSNNQLIDSLILATKQASASIPNLQLIIIGEGDEKKKLSWLTKKLNIENIVLFVGEPEQPQRWLHNFDLFIVTQKNLALVDFENILAAMTNQLPIIGPMGSGLENIIYENKNGLLVDVNNSEMLARLITKLELDVELRTSLGHVSGELATQYFNINEVANDFKKILLNS